MLQKLMITGNFCYYNPYVLAPYTIKQQLILKFHIVQESSNNRLLDFAIILTNLGMANVWDWDKNFSLFQGKIKVNSLLNCFISANSNGMPSGLNFRGCPVLASVFWLSTLYNTSRAWDQWISIQFLLAFYMLEF